MKYSKVELKWPVPNSYKKELPPLHSFGRFWADRGDRYHTGTDIYAPKGSEVIACESGVVIHIGIFTDPSDTAYWNKTYFVLVHSYDGLILNYAELESVSVKEGQEISKGHPLGTVAQVLNPDLINETSPSYINSLKENGHLCMLHFEVYSQTPLGLLRDKFINNKKGVNIPKIFLSSDDYLQNILNRI